MYSTLSEQAPFFSIRRLTEIREAIIEDRRDEVIELYLVFNGSLIITNKASRVLLKNKDLYWARYHEYQRLKVDEGTEGYAIHLGTP